jgi:hypothetical protein
MIRNKTIRVKTISAKTRKVKGGKMPERIGLMNPTWGGESKSRSGGACACQTVPKLPMPLGGGYKLRSDDYIPQSGGYKSRSGGYRATKRDLKYLKLWKQGKSIGFTIKSSLKAKGLIPRSNGTKRVSPKYR